MTPPLSARFRRFYWQIAASLAYHVPELAIHALEAGLRARTVRLGWWPAMQEIAKSTPKWCAEHETLHLPTWRDKQTHEHPADRRVMLSPEEIEMLKRAPQA